MSRPSSPPHSADTLLATLRDLADVVLVQLPEAVARLEFGADDRPMLWLDVDSPVEDQCWAMLDALRAITLGPTQAQSARRLRHLRSVC